MALSDKTNLLVQDYTRQQYPQLEEGIRRYIQEELRRIETSIGSLIRSSVQVSENPPGQPSQRHDPVRSVTLEPHRGR